MNKALKEKQETTTGAIEHEEMTKTRLFPRRSLSAFEHIALWTSVLRVVLSIGAVITFVLLKTPQNQDILSIGVFSLAIAVLLATKIRWASLVSIPLAVYLLQLTFVQPYVIASLGNPYDDAGGFIKFTTVVFVLAAAILVLIGCVGAAVQNYHKGSQRLAPRWLPAAVCLVIGMFIGGLYIGAFSQAAVLTEASANGVPIVHIGDIKFSRPSVTISKGSKLMFVDDTPVAHDLFNGSWQNGRAVAGSEPGAPVVSNVQLRGNSVVVGPFTTAGTYHIFCSVHTGMTLTIIVQ